MFKYLRAGSDATEKDCYYFSSKMMVAKSPLKFVNLLVLYKKQITPDET